MFASEDPFDRLRLIRSPNIGLVTYRQLTDRFGGATNALEALPDLVMLGGGKHVILADKRAVERELAATQNFGGRYLFWVIPNIRTCLPISTTPRLRSLFAATSAFCTAILWRSLARATLRQVHVGLHER